MKHNKVLARLSKFNGRGTQIYRARMQNSMEWSPYE
jgi:hypothetical protein